MLYTVEVPDSPDQDEASALLLEAVALIEAAQALRAQACAEDTSLTRWIPVLEFTVPGPPITKARPRVITQRNGRRRGLTPASTRLAENTVAWRFRQAVQGTDHTVDSLHRWRVDMVFYLPDRRSRDVDNLAKLILDALNGLAWSDDAQVQIIHATKTLDRAQPRTHITLHRAP